MKITFISDTHARQRHLIHTGLRHASDNIDLPGGDLLIHAGDFMTSGYSKQEAIEFFEWFNNVPNYTNKIFIAGNHDRIMQIQPEWAQETLATYENIDYLEDQRLDLWLNEEMDHQITLYGSPWQPEFYNWAYNLPRNGTELKSKWDAIPVDTDILITHGPAQTYLDTSGAPYNTPLLGCELLKERVELIRPKIHVCGHIHGSYGYYYNGHTHFFNASILNERYEVTNIPFNIEWDPITNGIKFN